MVPHAVVGDRREESPIEHVRVEIGDRPERPAVNDIVIVCIGGRRNGVRKHHHITVASRDMLLAAVANLIPQVP
jgi:hypothetical protein